MKNDHSKEFSFFSIKNAYVKLLDSESPAEHLGCIGKYESTMNTKTVVKKCEGVERKSRTCGDGTGTAKITLHMNMEVYRKIYGVKSDDYIKGVYSYGDDSVHKPFCLTAEVYDEDGNEMLLAVPNTIITTGKTMNIENGTEEVSEIEVELKIMPDEDNQGEYTAFVSELENDSVKTSWLTNFTSDLVKKVVPTE